MRICQISFLETGSVIRPYGHKRISSTRDKLNPPPHVSLRMRSSSFPRKGVGVTKRKGSIEVVILLSCFSTLSSWGSLFTNRFQSSSLPSSHGEQIL